MSALAMLHHLRIERVLWGEQKWLTWPTGSARSRKLFFDAIRMRYGSIVMLQLIRGEEGNMPIRTVTDARQQFIGIGLNVASHHEVDDYFVAWVKADPDPLITIDGCQFLKC